MSAMCAMDPTTDDPGKVEITYQPRAPVQVQLRRKWRLGWGLAAGLVVLVIALAIALGVALGVDWHKSSDSPVTPAGPTSNLTVYYAASLKDIMTRVINPGFTQAYSINVIPTAAASGALATLLQAGNSADVFISADAKINQNLLAAMLPGTTQPVASWYTFWARSRLGLAYNVNSQYASVFRAIESGSLPWYQGLNRTEMKIGRTDPNLDPKGYRTVIMTRLASIYYGVPGIEDQILGTPRNNLQIYTEQNLEDLLTRGDIDVGFFYDVEKQWGGDLRFISLPVYLDMSNETLNSYYAKANYTNTATNVTYLGSAIIYTLAIPNRATNVPGAISYVKYLRAMQGSSSGTLLNSEGLFAYSPSTPFSGNLSAVPMELRT